MSDTYTDITVSPPGSHAARSQPTADGGWDAFPAASNTNSWDAFPKAGGASVLDTAIDVGKSAVSGVGKGAMALAGLPGDVRSLIGKGMTMAGDAAGIPRATDAEADSHPSLMPTSTTVQKAFTDNVSEFHKPETTAGHYAETIGEFVPAAMAGPGGAARKLVTMAAIPGAASEAAGQATKGTSYEPWARAITAIVAGGGAAMLSRPSTAAEAIKRQLPEGISSAHVTSAERLIADAHGRGVNLTWPEALSQVSGRPVLTDTQRILESSPETRSRMQDFFSERPQQFDRAALGELDNIAPGNANPSSVGRQASEAAEGVLTDVRQTINRASEPYYKAAEGVLLTPAEMAHVKRIPGFSEARDAVRNNAQINWRVAHLPDESVGFLNQVKKHFDQAAENSGSKFNPAKNKEVQSSNEMAASALKQIGEAKSSDYAVALGIQKQAREQYLQPLLDGPLGRIANKPDTQKAINALFPTNPLPNSHHEISDAVSALANKNPYAATQLVRAYLESAFNEATRGLTGGVNQFGAAGFAKAVTGNAQQRENIRAAVEALPNGKNLWAGFDGFLEAAEASGTRQAKGSLTAFNSADRKMLEGSSALGESIKTGLSPGKWMSVIGDKWSKWKLGENLHEMSNIFTDPKSGKILRRIADMPVRSREAQYLASRLILQSDQTIANARDARTK